MRISKTWLSDYVDLSGISTEDFSEIITTRVAEVDEVLTIGRPLEHAKIGLITKVTKHPKKPELSIVSVNLGGEEVSVVCGAPNCKVGLLCAFIPPGGVAASSRGLQIDSEQSNQEAGLNAVIAREVHGIKSCGMLVSEAELELSSDHSGLLILADLSQDKNRQTKSNNLKLVDTLKPGDTLSDILGPPDTILVIDNKSLTHRPDLWGHFGFARELSAILHRPLKQSIDRFADDSKEGESRLAQIGQGKTHWTVEIDSSSACRRFSLLAFEGVSVQASPLWMRRRLYAIGAGIRNFLVDLSNYVMHDVGQPNHAYDVDQLSGNKIFVRNARVKERFLGLDSIERELSTEDVVIADENNAVALGGIIGGSATGVRESTTRLLLESANFDPVRIRLASKRHGLRTDASIRFEKGRTPYTVPLALCRFKELLLAEQPESSIVGSLSESFPERPKQVNIPISFNYLRNRLDPALNDEKIIGILSSLGFELQASGANILAKVPYYRATRDVSIQDDLVEEVGRIYAYDNITEKAPLIVSTAPKPALLKQLEYNIRDTLSGSGFSEIYNYSFMNKETAEKLGYSLSSTISLLNPVDSAENLLRTSLVPGMLSVIERNARFFGSIFVYELGRSYESKQPLQHANLKTKEKLNNPAAFERRLLSLVYSSGKAEDVISRTLTPELSQGGDFYALKSIIAGLVSRLSNFEIKLIPIEVGQSKAENGNNSTAADDYAAYKPWMHPYRAALIRVESLDEKSQNFNLGVLAEIRPGILDDVDKRVVLAELDTELLLEISIVPDHFKPLPRFPNSFFELSVVMPEKIHYTRLEKLIRENVDKSALRAIEPISIYQGAPLKSQQKSVSVRLSLGREDRTLAGEELEEIHARLVQAISGSEFHLRS